MGLSIKKLFFKNDDVKTFFITRLHETHIQEQVFLKQGAYRFNVTHKHSMICLDPFCIAVWIPASQIPLFNHQSTSILFVNNKAVRAAVKTSLIETLATANGALLLYKIKSVKNFQLSTVHRLVLFAYLLRSKKNTYQSRRIISALYSYPREIIMVSYRDESYYNIFPMDIQGYIPEEGIYLLGLRTTNITLDKILKAKKVVISDTDAIDINTVYDLGKHPSKAPTQINHMAFEVNNSEMFNYPVPGIAASYKEIEIIDHKKMGYHMLLIGKVVNAKVIRENGKPLYHVGFLQSKQTNYQSIDGIY